MMLSLPSLPRITIWFQAKSGGHRLEEHLAPGFDESCRYLEYKPKEDFIFLIKTEERADTLKQCLAFMIEMDGQDIGYFPVSGPKGFMVSERSGKNQTISIRPDFAGNSQIKFKFPKRGTLEQMIVRVFVLKPLQVVPASADFNIYKWRRTTRDIRQYHILNDSEVRALAARKDLENILSKHVDDEPAAVFRFKHRTYKQLQELSVIPSPVPNPPNAPVAAPFPTVAEEPAQPIPKPPNLQYAYVSVPKSFPVTAERLAQAIDKTLAQPPESIQRPAVNLPPSLGQSSAQTERNEQGVPRLDQLESYPNRLAALKQRLGRSEDPPAQAEFDGHGRPSQLLLESYRKGPSDMRRSLGPVDEDSYMPPAVPRFGSGPLVLREVPAQVQKSKAAEQPIGMLTALAPGQQSALGRIGEIVQMAPNWASTWGPVLPPPPTIPWASIWGTLQTETPLASFNQENVSLNVNSRGAVKEVEEGKGIKRKREEHEGSDEDETTMQRPAKRMCVGQ